MCSGSSRIPIAVLPRLYNRERGSVTRLLVAHPCEEYFTLRQLLCSLVPSLPDLFNACTVDVGLAQARPN